MSMIPISQRLRARLEPVGDGSGKWRPDGLCQEAANVVDALVEALELNRRWVDWDGDRDIINAALAKAKGNQE